MAPCERCEHSVFPLSRSSVAISPAVGTAWGDVWHQLCSTELRSPPRTECSQLTVGCTGPSGATVPSLAWERAVVVPPPRAQSGAWLRLAAGGADVPEAEVMLTSICYKLGGNSHAASPQILQCRSPQPCSAAVTNSVSTTSPFPP